MSAKWPAGRPAETGWTSPKTESEAETDGATHQEGRNELIYLHGEDSWREGAGFPSWSQNGLRMLGKVTGWGFDGSPGSEVEVRVPTHGLNFPLVPKERAPRLSSGCGQKGRSVSSQTSQSGVRLLHWQQRPNKGNEH